MIKLKSIITLIVLMLLSISVFAGQNISDKTEIQINLKSKQIGKGTVFYGKTNLPDGTKLGIT